MVDGIQMQSSWKCPSASSLKLLLVDENGEFVEHASVLAKMQICEEADYVIASWARKQRIDMLWTISLDTQSLSACGTVHSRNFDHEPALFPREFLDTFVGKRHTMLDSSVSMLLSTCS